MAIPIFGLEQVSFLQKTVQGTHTRAARRIADVTFRKEATKRFLRVPEYSQLGLEKSVRMFICSFVSGRPSSKNRCTGSK